jgi:hypothetical protein
MDVFVIAALEGWAFWLLYLWLASAIAASLLSEKKGYGEKFGLGTGLLLSAIGVVVWLLIPAKPGSDWKRKKTD